MKRSEQREWLVRIAYQELINQSAPFSPTEILRAHGLPETNAYLVESLTSLAENASAIDEKISARLMDWTPERLRKIDRAILRVAVNELLFTKFAPVSVTMNESVELAKRYSDPAAYQFINGLLSRLVREEELSLGMEDESAT